MRYFKCDLHIDNSALKAQYHELSGQERRALRRAKVLSKLGTVIFVLVTALVLIAAFTVWKLFISKEEETVLLTIVNVMLGILWGGACLVLAPMVAIFAAIPFWNKYPGTEKKEQRLLLSKGCVRLKEYYGFCKPFLVTKCFDSTDRRFRRHDVCLFFVEGELRLTVNLHYGFFDSERDLGCYAFRREELQLQSVPHAGHPAAELKCGDTVFLLGIRAEKFIRDHFDPPRQE